MSAETATVQTKDESAIDMTRHAQSDAAESDHTQDLEAVHPAEIAVLNAIAASDALDDPDLHPVHTHHDHTEHIRIDDLGETKRQLVKAVRPEIQRLAMPTIKHPQLLPSAAKDQTTSRILWRISLALFRRRKTQNPFAREGGAPTNPVQAPSTHTLQRTTTLQLTYSPTMTDTPRISNHLAAPLQVS